MTKQEFSKYLEQRLQRIKDTLDKKGEEYAYINNVFVNFEDAGDIAGNCREKIMFYYMLKHLISVINIVNKADKYEYPIKEVIEEKFGDLVNYLILIEASLIEQIKD
jgi:hypothetical protein